jgi:hypothetical protein
MDLADLDERYWETEPHFGRTYQKYSLLQQITLTPVDEVGVILLPVNNNIDRFK